MTTESDSKLKFEIGHVLLIDIVGYSKLLITEQSEFLRRLTDVVRATEQFRLAEAEGKLVRLPTGDGMALVFRDSPETPVQCALELSKKLKAHPELRVRMGIHSGPVNEVADVNERTNITGAGINMAQRVMDCGDAGHILLSKRVADDLEQYPQWRPHLHELGECEVKHGLRVHVVNLYTDELGNPELPEKFKGADEKEQTAVAARLPARSKPLLITLAILICSLVGLAIVAIIFAPAASKFFSNQRAATRSTPPPFPSPASGDPALAEKSIAVLPFADLSQAKDQEYFCDGISEELLDSLAKIEGLRVVARTSSFSFKGKTVDAGEIAQKLGVQHILEGSLRRDGNRIRITAQLINARDGFHLWSQTYEREMQSVFALQDEITRAITEALKMKLVGAPRASAKVNMEAYDLYLQGVFFSNKSTEEGLRKSLEFFQRSLEKDPNSAKAWAGVAKAWVWLADAYVKPLDAFLSVREAAAKALALDEREPEAHIYVSEVKRVLDWDMAGSDAGLERALQLDPNSASAHLFFLLNSLAQGKGEKAAMHIRAGLKADPLSPLISNFATLGYLSLGQFDEAIAEGKRMKQLDPNFLYSFPVLAAVYHDKGMFAEAIELFEEAQKVTGVPQPGLALSYTQVGRQAEARQILDELVKISTTRHIPAEEIASIHVALGEKDEALAWLNRACEEHSGGLHAIAFRRAFHPLHSDPRFAAILKRIGLDPATVLIDEGRR